MTRKAFLNLAVTRNRLGCLALGVLIPVMVGAMTDEDTAFALDDPDEVDALHFRTSSPTFRTPGIFPLVSSW